MLIHIVVWKYRDEVSEEERSRHVKELENLPSIIPNIESYRVGRDILHLDRSYDTGLVAVFPDKQALDFYTEHKAHQDVASFGKRIAEHVVSVDFLSPR
jgi:hypothetical protein